MSKASMNEGYLEYLEDQAAKYENLKNRIREEHESIGTLKSVVSGVKAHYGRIDEITVIEGYDILFSGEYTSFDSNCSSVMIDYRNKLLTKKVVAKKVLTSNEKQKLFVFLV